VAAFELVINPDTLVRSVRIVQADPFVEIADQVLEQGDPEFLSVGDGIVTFHGSNGDVTYGLRDHDDLRECWIGVRSDLSPLFVEDIFGAHTREG
jgi:hypothetical protein